MRSSFCGLIPHNDERVVRGPPAAVPAAPDQPAAPTPPLPSPRNDRTRCHQSQTPGAASPDEHRDRELRAGRPGCGRRRQLCADRCGRSDTPAGDGGGSAEPPPHWGQRPLARERRRGSTCRAAAAAAGRSRVGTGFAAAGHPVAACFMPELGSHEWPLTARRANGDAPATPGSGRLCPASSAPSAAVTSHGGRRQGGLDPARVAPHPTAPAISCPCNVTCSSTTGSGPRGRPSHRPGSAQVCGKPATQRVN
jgi:hypothetical protein